MKNKILLTLGCWIAATVVCNLVDARPHRLPDDTKTLLSTDVGYKYHLSICAIFKNEKKYLREWIEYHRLIGVDHFYLYNNNSSDRPLDLLLPYIKQGIVTVISWPDTLDTSEEDSQMWALSTQISAYENAIKFRAKNATEWLVLMNIDEFLVPRDQMHLKELLKRYEDYPGVLLQQNCFDAAEGSMTSHQLLIEVNERIAPETLVCTGVEKMVFKPQLCEYFTWPPYKYIFKNNRAAIKMHKQELCIHRYLHRFKDRLHFGKSQQKLCLDTRLLAEEDVQALLENHYVVKDQDNPMMRYIPLLKKILGTDR